MIKVILKPEKGIQIDSTKKYLFDPSIVQQYVDASEENAVKAENSAKEAQQVFDDLVVYTDNAKTDIDNKIEQGKTDIEDTKNTAIETINSTVSTAKSDINTAVDEATTNISNIVSDAEGSITNIAVTEANKAIANSAQEATDIATASLNSYVDGTVKPSLQTYVDSAQEDANSAATSMEQAALSATAASNYASNASADADNAAESAGLAANSAGSAATSEEKAAEYLQQVSNKITAVEGSIGDIGFTPLGIDEAQNKRRYLNGQVISQAQFVSFTNKIKYAIELYPNLATSETNWQAEVTNSKLGQCGKFVIDDTLGTIRLPKVVNVQGLADLSLMGSIKAESLPNINGTLGFGGGSLTRTGVFSAEPNNVYGSYGGGDTSGANYFTRFSASSSSSTYQNNAPVQQEAIQYPYFIQVATGVEETVDVTREIELNNPFFLGMSQYFEVEPNNISWLKSNGAFHSGATYVSFYEWLLKIYNGTETVNGVSVKASTDTYGDYDYVINTADMSFRLPLLDGSESLLSDKYINLTFGATNSAYTALANGWFCARGKASATSNSFIYLGCPETNIHTQCNGDGFVGTNNLVYLPAKKGNVVYLGYNSISDGTIQFIYAKGNGSLYFYVGETVQDANVINASGVLTRVAELSDEYIVGLGMPDYSAGIGLGGLTTFTAPTNGIAYIINNFKQTIEVYINGVYLGYSLSNSQTTGTYILSKGDVLTTSSGINGTSKFFPLKGAN